MTDNNLNFIEIEKDLDLNILIQDFLEKKLQEIMEVQKKFEPPLLHKVREIPVLKAILSEVETRGVVDFVEKCNPEEILDLRLKLECATDERERSRIEEKINSLKVDWRLKYVIVCQEFTEIADECGFPIRYVNADFYIFDGRYWKRFKREFIFTSLVYAASCMGVDEILVKRTEDGETLIRQLQTLLQFTFENSENKNVKINLQNGTFVFNGEGWDMKNFDASDYLTYCLPFAYDENAEAPLFDKFLNRCFPSVDLQDFLAECFGYCLTGNFLRLEKAFFFCGVGANGKSVLCKIMKHMFGCENVGEVSMPSLCDKNGTSIPELFGKVVNICTETDWGGFNENKFKALVSGEAVTAKKLYENPISYAVSCKFIFCLNQLPSYVKSYEATLRRCIFIPCKVIIPENERDGRLAEKIIESELPGVFNWVLRGLKNLIQRGRFEAPQEVLEQDGKVKLEVLNINQFLEEKNWSSDEQNKVLLKEFYGYYVTYSNESGNKPCPKNEFSHQLRSLGYRVEKHSRNQTYVWCKQHSCDVNEQEQINKLIEL